VSDSRLSLLEDRLASLERRLATVESALSAGVQGAAPITESSAEPVALAEEQEQPSERSGVSIVSLLGRFLIILGGAFFLRAATDAGTLPAAAGVTAGLVYGVAQLWLASRAASRGQEASANWLGFGGAFILLPLIAESTLDFEILSPSIAAILLPFLGFAGVAIAFRHRLRPMAWAFFAGTGSVGLFLAAKTGFALGFPIGVIVVGIAGLWMGYLRQWYGLAIVGSVVPVALVFVSTLLMALDFEAGVATSLTPTVALVLQLLLVAGFLGSFLARALRWSTPVGLPEMMQAVLAMVFGILGALISATKDPSLGKPFGIAMLITGQMCYATSFLRIDQREDNRQNFAFFSSVALAATLTGAAQILDGTVELALFIFAALALAWFGARRSRATLSLHAAIYVVGAGFVSGLSQRALDSLMGEGVVLPPVSELTPMLVVLAVGFVCLGAPVASSGRTWGRLSRLCKYVYLGFLGTSICGLIVMILTGRLAATPDGGLDSGMVAAFRTGALAVMAIVLGYTARWPKLREAGRVVPAVLVLGALALGLGDLRSGRAATQFVSMALYGLALIVAPRLARRAGSSNGSDFPAEQRSATG
jgi:hypothetical protein